jgi:hypothetical protein
LPVHPWRTFRRILDTPSSYERKTKNAGPCPESALRNKHGSPLITEARRVRIENSISTPSRSARSWPKGEGGR